MARSQTRIGGLLDRGLVFFGIKEEEFSDRMFESSTPEYEAPSFASPRMTTPAAPEPLRPVVERSSSVQVVGGGSGPRAAAQTIARDITPPSGISTVSSGVAETKDVELFVARSYNDCKAICDILKSRRAVVLNTGNCDVETGRRIQAFVCGYIYAVNGRIQSVVKGQVIIAEPVRTLHTAPEAIERYRRNNFEF